jgi:hypothetical protein
MPSQQPVQRSPLLVHVPPRQVCPAAHAAPQLPQLLASLAVSTQSAPQRLFARGHGDAFFFFFGFFFSACAPPRWSRPRARSLRASGPRPR